MRTLFIVAALVAPALFLPGSYAQSTGNSNLANWVEVQGDWLYIPETWCDQKWTDAKAASQAVFLIGNTGPSGTMGGHAYTKTELVKLKGEWLNCLECRDDVNASFNIPWGATSSQPMKCSFGSLSMTEEFSIFWDHVQECNPGVTLNPTDFAQIFQTWAQEALNNGGCGNFCLGIQCNWGEGCGPFIIGGIKGFQEVFGYTPDINLIDDMISDLNCDDPPCQPFVDGQTTFDWLEPDIIPGTEWCDINHDGLVDDADLMAMVASSGDCNTSPLTRDQTFEIVLEWFNCRGPIEPDPCAHQWEWAMAAMNGEMGDSEFLQIQHEGDCIECSDPGLPPGDLTPLFPPDIPHPPGQFPCDPNGSGLLDDGDFDWYLGQMGSCNPLPDPFGGDGPASWAPDDLILAGAFWGDGVLNNPGCWPPVFDPCHFVIASISDSFSQTFNRPMNPAETGQLLLLLPDISGCGPTPPAPCSPQQPPLWNGIPPSGTFPIPALPGSPLPCDLSGDNQAGPLDLMMLLGHTANCNPAGLGDNDIGNIAAWWLDGLGQQGCGPPPCEETIQYLNGIVAQPMELEWLGIITAQAGCDDPPPPPDEEPEPPPSDEEPPPPDEEPPESEPCGGETEDKLDYTPDPVSVMHGHKLESATDLSVSLPGRDFALVRSYSSKPDYGGSGLMGFHWDGGPFWFLSIDGNGNASTKLVLATPSAGKVTFYHHSGNIWRSTGSATQYIEKDLSQSPNVWRLVERGAYALEFYMTGAGPDPALDGLIYRQVDPYGNQRTYDYYLFDDGTGVNTARLDTLFLDGTDDSNSAAKIQFSWILPAGNGNQGRLAKATVIRWDAASQPVQTQRVTYTYKSDGDGNHPAVGTEGDLIQVVRETRVDDGPEGMEPWMAEVTQYRYHGGLANEDGIDADGDGFANEAGEPHQLKAVFKPQQIEHAIQKLHEESPVIRNVAVEADALLALADEAGVFSENGETVTMSEIAAKFIETYGNWDSNNPEVYPGRVKTQHLQADCGCGGTRGVRIGYEYHRWPGAASGTYARSTHVSEELANGAGYDPYRSTFYDMIVFYGPDNEPLYRTANIVRQDDLDPANPRWVTHFEYDLNSGQLVARLSPAAMSAYQAAGEGPGGKPTYQAHASAGRVNAFRYNSDRRLEGRYVRNGYHAIQQASDYDQYTLVERLTYGDSTHPHLATLVERFRTSQGPYMADDVETMQMEYGFHSGQSDGVAWRQIREEAEATNENGPGGYVYRHRIYDTLGRLSWAREADSTLVRRAYSSKTGALTELEKNAAQPASWGQPMPPGFAFAGRNGDGGSLIMTITHDLLGRPRETSMANGVVTKTLLQMRRLPQRPGILYLARLSLPHHLADESSLTFRGPATVTWQTASGGPILEHDYSLIEPGGGESSDFGIHFNNYDFSLGSILARNLVRHNYSGQILERMEWHNLNGEGEGDGIHTTQYTYDRLGRMEDVTAPNNTIIRRQYDIMDRVILISVGTTTGNLLPRTEYFFDSLGQPVHGLVGNGNLTLVRKHVDNSSHRDLEQRFDWRDRLEMVIEPEGSHAVHSWDNLNRPTGEALFSEIPTDISQVSGRGRYTRYSYSQRGKRYRTETAIDPDQSESGYLAANSWFDPHGQVVASRQPGRPMIKISRDATGRLISQYMTDGRGGAAYGDVYDPISHRALVDGDMVLEQIHNDFVQNPNRGFGQVELVTHLRRAHTLSDVPGDLVGQRANQVITTYEGRFYDAAGRQIRTVNYGSNDSQNRYIYGGAVPVIDQANPPDPSPSASMLITGFSYDVRGLVDTTTDPKGVVQRMFYDDRYRSVAVATAGSGVSLSWDDVANRWTASGLSGGARVTSVVLDGIGNVVKRISHLPDGGGEQAQITEYLYQASAGMGYNQSRLNSYDHVTEVRYPDPLSGLPGQSSGDKLTFAYNRQGETRFYKDQNGTEHLYTLDHTGRVTRDFSLVQPGSGIDDTVKSLSFEYDDFGRMVAARSLLAGDVVQDSLTFDYTGLWEIEQFGQHPNGDTNSPGSQLSWTRDTLGFNPLQAENGSYSRVTAMVHPNGTQAPMAYGSAGSVDDRISRLSKIGIDEHDAVYSFLGWGMVATMDFLQPGIRLARDLDQNGNQAFGTFPGWNRYGQVVRQMWVDSDFQNKNLGIQPAKPAIVEQVMAYDNVGNPLYELDGRMGASRANRDFLFTHDNLSRLTQAKRGVYNGMDVTPANGGRKWSYDQAGNWDQVSTDHNGDGDYNDPGELSDGSFDMVNQITEFVVDESLPVALSFNHDQAGNVIDKGLTADEKMILTHDAWNRLVKVDVDHQGSVSTLAAYRYNALNHRMAEERDTDDDGLLDQLRTSLTTPAWQVVQEDIDDNYTTSPGVDRSYQYLWGIRAVDDILMTRSIVSGSGTTRYHLTDSRFSTLALVSETGVVSERVSYDAYGQARHHHPGDLDGDGSLTQSEVNQVQQLYLASLGINDPGYRCEADLNRNGEIDVSDYDTLNLLLLSSPTPDIPALPKGTLSASDNRIGYGGYMLDGVTGLYHVRNRWYDPLWGRWMERDPAGYIDGMNLYQYVQGGPLRRTDPFGLGPCDDIQDINKQLDCMERLNGGNYRAGSYPRTKPGQELARQVLDTADVVGAFFDMAACMTACMLRPGNWPKDVIEAIIGAVNPLPIDIDLDADSISDALGIDWKDLPAFILEHGGRIGNWYQGRRIAQALCNGEGNYCLIENRRLISPDGYRHSAYALIWDDVRKLGEKLGKIIAPIDYALTLFEDTAETSKRCQEECNCKAAASQ